MSEVDFRKIRSDFPNGQRGAFEELVCQLARREASSLNSFRRIQGSGGDGGVECIEISNAGVTGYQAKFYTKTGDIDWAAIDNSVQTAMRLYPNLIRYVIAIPCDFTGRRESGGSRITEGAWGSWNQRCQKWETAAHAAGRNIAFMPWTEFELRERLTPTNAEGLRAYWFQEVEFSANWFRLHIESAIASLDERYSPQDHVDVRLQDIFDFLVKHPRAVAALEERFRVVRTSQLPTFSEVSASQGKLLKAAEDNIARVLECEADLRESPWQNWDREKWENLIAAARKSVTDIRVWCQKEPRRSEYELNPLSRLQGALESLDTEVSESVTSFGRTSSVLLYGTAGTGKSHLLARIADAAVAEGRPTVLWLGQQLRYESLWPQLLQRLGITLASPEQFLGALDAAAQARGTRALLLIDAINEGAGARLWREEISAFLKKVSAYQNVAIVLSCRSEYLKYLVPAGTLKKLKTVEVRGFETDQEQAAAAKVYLDKRGISRPATPWLAPEFVNPLFLRSCCNALQRAGRREFPRGLAGTKAILSFYLESIGRNLGVGRDGSDELVAPMKNSLVALARTMALERRSYTSVQRSIDVISDSFKPYLSPGDLTWFDVLRRNGLLRLDPDPTIDGDSFSESVNVVRFSFQRFQDHLMAEALVADVVDIRQALSDDGSLRFIRGAKEFAWEWRGLIEALAIQVPERFGCELVDALPGQPNDWWPVYFTQDAFLESIRWRSVNAFTVRTLALFNSLDQVSDSPLSRLIELSASVDHPWNAELIHRNLIRLPMNKRDAFWTNHLNVECSDEKHSVHRLIDWCLRPEIKSADPRTIDLCSVILAWLFTLSNRPVRDRATKALANVLLAYPDVFAQLLTKFEAVDDPYVLERIFAAAYGAACNDPNATRVRNYARLAAEKLFCRDHVPENLLVRDFGRGLIELAEQMGVKPADLALEKSHPPYRSLPPRLSATRAQIEELAKKAGDKNILFSCGAWGDFGRYEIEPALRRFTATRLTRPAPLSPEKRFFEFVRQVVDPSPERKAAWHSLQALLVPRIHIEFVGSTAHKSAPEPSREEVERWREAVRSAEKAFQDLLTKDECKRYSRYIRSYLHGKTNLNRDHRRIDLERAQSWVARRAYQLGGALRGFPWSRGSLNPDQSRPQVERLGKKYQWIALDELVCKLADNYWMSEFGGDTKRYEYPSDVGFLRDIDPTILAALPPPSPKQWMGAPRIVLEPQGDDGYAWPFSVERASELERLITRTDAEGSQWLTAYEHQSVETPREDHGDFPWGRSYRRQEFRFVCLVIVHEKDRDTFVQSVSKARTLDIHAWGPREFIDGPYLLEAAWRPTWQSDTWENDDWNDSAAPRAFPVSEYHWESHLDRSLPDGCRELLPSPWLMRKLGLRKNLQMPDRYDDSHGSATMLYGRGGSDGRVALFKSDWFTEFVKREALACVWLYLNERLFIIGDMCGAWRRTEGIAWMEGTNTRTITWQKDNVKKEKL